MKFGITQLFIEVLRKFFTCFIPSDTEAIVVEGITKWRTTPTINFRLVMAKVYYGRGFLTHVVLMPYAVTLRIWMRDFKM